MPETIATSIYEPYHHQADFHRARKLYPYRWLSAGVGTGKSVVTAMEALFLGADINAGCPGLLVVPDFATFEDTIRPVLTKFWPEEVYRITRSQNRPAIKIHSRNGDSIVYVRSAHNRQNIEKLISLSVSWVWMEEAARFSNFALVWKYCLERLRFTAPYMGIFISSTPKPGPLPETFGVAQGLPREALIDGYCPGGKHSDHWVRQAKTEWNLSNPETYAERMRATFGPGKFAAQELDGQIVPSSGLIYPDFAKGLHVIPHDLAKQMFERSCRRRVGGVDWGWSNPGACVWGGWIEDGGAFLALGEWYRAGCQAEQQGAETYKKAGDGFDWFCDGAEPRHVHKWRHGFQWEGRSYSLTTFAADKAWLPGTDAVRNLMHRRSGLDHPAHPAGNAMGAPRLYISERCVNLIREFAHLRDANDPEDVDKVPKEGYTIGDDHAIDALRYAVYSTQLKRPATALRSAALG